MKWFWHRLRTLGAIVRHFARRQKWFLVPLLDRAACSAACC